MRSNSRLISHPDYTRLCGLLDALDEQLTRDREQLEALRSHIDSTTVVASTELLESVISLHSQVRLRDLDSGRDHVCTVVLPAHGEVTTARGLSLSCSSAALLGARVGDELQWPLPSGPRRVRIEKILFRPEFPQCSVRARTRARRANTTPIATSAQELVSRYRNSPRELRIESNGSGKC